MLKQTLELSTNGIKAMFGKTINYLWYTLVIFTALVVGSCKFSQPDSCRWAKEIYQSEWNHVVSKIYRFKKFKATWVLEMTNGESYYIRPNQSIVTWAERGDKLIKPRNSGIVQIIKKDSGFQDTIISRLYSISCDDDIAEKEKL